MAARRTRLGWLGPAILVLGLVVGALGVWWMLRAKPAPGEVIDRIPIDPDWTVVVRHEAHSERAMIELVDKSGGVEWQALIPPYAGRAGVPAVAAANNAISVRVVRQRPELWVMATRNATKLGAIGLDTYAPGGWNRDGRSRVITAGDGVRSYEVVDGRTGTAVVGVDLERGAVIWHRDFPAAVRAVTVRADGRVEIGFVDSSVAAVALDPATGRE